MTGPLNRYRCMDLDWKELKDLSLNKIEKPACFITGDLDPVNFFVPNVNFFESIGENYNDLRKKLVKSLSYIEAKIDFAEDDLPEKVLNEVNKSIKNIHKDTYFFKFFIF